jgi:hypothetical protein
MSTGSQRKKIDTITDWTGTFRGERYRVYSDDGGVTIKTDVLENIILISKVNEGAYQFNRQGNPQKTIGLAFRYCDGSKQLWMVNTSDETQVSYVASQIENDRVLQFQSTTWETGPPRDKNDPAYVGFGLYTRE